MTATFASLSGPDFLKLSRRQIKALSLDALQLLVLRSQRLLATAPLFKPVQCLFEVMPDEFVIEIFLEWLDIEELAAVYSTTGAPQMLRRSIAPSAPNAPSAGASSKCCGRSE